MMEVSSKLRLLAHIVETPFLRNILFACLAIVIIFPLYAVFIVCPSFTELLIESAKNDAIRAATYLGPAVVTADNKLVSDAFSDALAAKIEIVKRDFQLEQIKIFSKSGEVIYSDDPKYIGIINDREYFREVVAKGKVYATMVRRGARSLEGRVVTRDVVETYVPLMSRGTLIGAFEIYYDITERKEKLDALLFRSIAALFALASGLLIVAIIILFKASQNIIERKRAERALERSEAELRAFTFQLFRTQEEERKRLALEIKDSIGQSLSAIKYRVEAALQEIGQKTPVKSVKSLEPVVPVVIETVEEVRKIQTELRPSILDELGLLPTVAWLCREVETIHPGIQIRQKIEVQETDVPDSLKIVIFRVMQEALNNVAKHSQANLALLSLRGTKSRIEFTIDDNGVGFDVDCVMSGDPFKIGFGLLTMKERVELSGGSFLLKSQTGSGTTVSGSWQC